MVNSLLRGYSGGQITLRTGAMKSRRINIINGEINQFYQDSISSLVGYIKNQRKQKVQS